MKKITAPLVVLLAFVGLAAVADQLGWLAAARLDAPLAA